MPEMRFAVRWPDGVETTHYSPSLVMHDYLAEGLHYPLDDFIARSTDALRVASERVREKYGFACTSAMESEDGIVRVAAGYRGGEVTVVSMQPPLPGESA